MLEAAAEHRYAYYAVTDHAPNLYMQRMTDEKMLDQRRRLRALQDRYPSMRLLHGTELNIDPDGGVDWDEEFLDGFDLTVASVHSHFGQSKDQMTRRVIRAIENPEGQHHRAPDHTQDRTARSRRSRSRGGVRGGRPHRDGARRSTPTPTGSISATSTCCGRDVTGCDSRSTPTRTRWATST